MEHTFLDIEGTDGCGKKTQIQNLHDYFKSRGKNVLIVSFPSYESPSSGPVKMYLGGEFGDKADCLDAYQASSLYAVDRLCTMKKIMKSLTEPTVILFDRYTQSNMIHQAGKIHDDTMRDKFLEWVDDFEFNILHLPRPDKTIFLDVPPHISYEILKKRTAQKSGRTKDIHENDATHLEHAHAAAKYVAKKFSWTIIDCLSQDSTFDTIDMIFKKLLKELEEFI